MKVEPLTPDDLIAELDFDRYLSEADSSAIKTTCRDVFTSQIEKTSDGMEHVESALEFIKTIWRKYDCEQVANVYSKFIKMEEALFGLERDEETGRRYRDHFVHMFNCYVFGLRTISSLLNQCKAETARKIFKTEDEKLKELRLPFGGNYEYHQRLFYLWTLISTFHDIAIPFQHLPGLGKGISAFVEEFGWVCTDPHVSMHEFDSSQLHYYFDVIGSIWGGKLKTEDRGRKYKRADRKQHYLSKLLGREFDRRNHGVLSGFFMWKTIEEIFLVDRSRKYPLNMDQFGKYTEFVLEQDIARAALAISLHAIGRPAKFLPIDFDQFPLTFLLILADELQEYLRWEGSSIRRELKFHCHPRLDVKYDATSTGVRATVSFSLESEKEAATVALARRIAKAMGSELSTDTISGAADLIGNLTKKTLEEKLKLGENFKLRLNIYEDWDENKTRYSKDLSSPVQCAMDL